ncbi:hypothetical protein AB0C77_12890 [Streptomyces sp. NPDC048629]|uniref:hypothetical protein n=1 Tax=Streptomyces sp. NPDC048629 TaxID=3154824 RepID=UPI00342D7505
MTARRTLGPGPETPTHIRATQADLLAELPGIRLPDLAELRDRGVLGPRRTVTAGTRRPLGAGGRAETDSERG